MSEATHCSLEVATRYLDDVQGDATQLGAASALRCHSAWRKAATAAKERCKQICVRAAPVAERHDCAGRQQSSELETVGGMCEN